MADRKRRKTIVDPTDDEVEAAKETKERESWFKGLVDSLLLVENLDDSQKRQSINEILKIALLKIGNLAFIPPTWLINTIEDKRGDVIVVSNIYDSKQPSLSEKSTQRNVDNVSTAPQRITSDVRNDIYYLSADELSVKQNSILVSQNFDTLPQNLRIANLERLLIESSHSDRMLLINLLFHLLPTNTKKFLERDNVVVGDDDRQQQITNQSILGGISNSIVTFVSEYCDNVGLISELQRVIETVNLLTHYNSSNTLNFIESPRWIAAVETIHLRFGMNVFIDFVCSWSLWADVLHVNYHEELFRNNRRDIQTKQVEHLADQVLLLWLQDPTENKQKFLHPILKLIRAYTLFPGVDSNHSLQIKVLLEILADGIAIKDMDIIKRVFFFLEDTMGDFVTSNDVVVHSLGTNHFKELWLKAMRMIIKSIRCSREVSFALPFLGQILKFQRIRLLFSCNEVIDTLLFFCKSKEKKDFLYSNDNAFRALQCLNILSTPSPEIDSISPSSMSSTTDKESTMTSTKMTSLQTTETRDILMNVLSKDTRMKSRREYITITCFIIRNIIDQYKATAPLYALKALMKLLATFLKNELSQENALGPMDDIFCSMVQAICDMITSIVGDSRFRCTIFQTSELHLILENLLLLQLGTECQGRVKDLQFFLFPTIVKNPIKTSCNCCLCFRSFEEEDVNRCTIIKCGHSTCCFLCSLKLQETNNSCPVCRKDIDAVVRIYL
eukprot:Awhi_evm1s13870